MMGWWAGGKRNPSYFLSNFHENSFASAGVGKAGLQTSGHVSSTNLRQVDVEDSRT